MSWMMTVAALVSLSGVANAGADCTPCDGTIVYSGGSCICLKKLPLMLPEPLEPLPEDDGSAPPWVGWRVGLTYDGFDVCEPDEGVIGYIEIDDGWVEVVGDTEVLDFWISLNE